MSRPLRTEETCGSIGAPSAAAASAWALARAGLSLTSLTVLLWGFSSACLQLTYPKVKPVYLGCQAQHVEQCRTGCPVQYQDPRRYLCPCYSKLSQCLVAIGCSMKQKVDIFTFCTRKGYCKDGYCTFRAGDLTPRIDTRPEVFELTSVATPGSPCIDNCCPGQTTACTTQDATMLGVRAPGRAYRKEEVTLPPRQGDPRVGVNQNYDRMPYSIPLANLP